ncbi:hypothetical protein SAMN05661080_02104 [Modestobacter sp. DSM 44400]|uniref:hypothetical protein n=1 Tax=Modestobacter sp. DSM 44400 TaxID=1550230 RepID=UPI00089D3969|nr:hypothetical protein [Modestobacter sp. DSM 44400]SDY04317.1 hypothetical protein SAMN05661080_02104 [Modestobacter sp. DSM 44400]
MQLKKTATKTSLAIALALTATLGLGACGANDTASNASGTSSSASTSVETAAADAVATVPAIPGGMTEVALDADFVAALGTLGLTPGVIGGATLTDGTVAFPITGGTVTLYDKTTGYRPWVQGILFHEGSGLSLTAGATTVELTDFAVDPGKPARLFGNVSVNGQLAASSAPLFDLNGKNLEPPTMNADGSVELTGTSVNLSPEAAALLNQTFATDALSGGLVIGIATITVETK